VVKKDKDEHSKKKELEEKVNLFPSPLFIIHHPRIDDDDDDDEDRDQQQQQ